MAGGEQLREGFCSEPAVQFRPPRRGPGHQGGDPPGLGHFRKAQGPHLLPAEGGGGGAAGVEAVELLLFFHPHQGEAVAAQAVAGGLQQGHGGGHSHRRVHRVAPRLHHVQADLGPLGDGGAGHGLAGVYYVPAGGVGVVSRIKLRHSVSLPQPAWLLFPVHWSARMANTAVRSREASGMSQPSRPVMCFMMAFRAVRFSSRPVSSRMAPEPMML